MFFDNKILCVRGPLPCGRHHGSHHPRYQTDRFQEPINGSSEDIPCGYPEPFATELRKCKDDAEAKEVGVEWCIQQCKDLIVHGVPSLHFYTMMASDSVYKIAKKFIEIQ